MKAWILSLLVGSAATLAEARSAVDCKTYAAGAELGAFIWGLPKLYFVGKRSAKNPGNGNAILYRADIVSGKHKKIMAFKSTGDVAIVPHGNPRIQALSIVNFGDGAGNCREGQASAMGVVWEKEQKTYPTYPAANYKLIMTDDGPELVDLGTNTFELLDVVSLQKRKLVSFEPTQIPLYVQKAPVQLIAFNPQTRELQKFEYLKKEASATVRLKADMKLLQQNDKFSMLSSKADGRTLQIAQFKDWSGTETRVFELNLPAGWNDRKSQVLLDFESGLAYVQPLPAYRKEQRNILVFDGPGKQMLKSLQAPAGAYFAAASLAPDGKRLAILVADLKDDGALALWLEERGTTKKFDLSKANEEAKEAAVAAPATPVAPAAPAAPAAAKGPAAPAAPAGPVSPGAPAGPVSPGAPAGPVSPGAPAVPPPAPKR